MNEDDFPAARKDQVGRTGKVATVNSPGHRGMSSFLAEGFETLRATGRN